MIEEALKDADKVLEDNRDATTPDALKVGFEVMQAAAHKLAEAMYKTAGAAEGGGDGDHHGAPPPNANSDVIDAEFEDKA